MQSVRDFLSPFGQGKKAFSLSFVASSLKISISTVWRVAKKIPDWYPHKPRKVIPLTPDHMVSRLTSCDGLLKQPVESPDRVLWRDEK